MLYWCKWGILKINHIIYLVNYLSGSKQAGIVGYTLDDPIHSMAARDGCYVVSMWYSGIDAILVQVGDLPNSLTKSKKLN